MACLMQRCLAKNALRVCRLVALLAGLMPALAAVADPPLPDGTDEATRAIATFRVPSGMQVELFAAEPKLGAPVAIALDEQGHVYVAEEYRFNRGTEENRTRPFLLEDDLQIQTLDDRLAMFKKWAHKFPGGMEWFSRYSDQVRLLEDRDGDGRADFSSVFAGGFNDPLDGLAAGVLAREGDVYFTCIPNLWLLRDTDGDGKADVRKVLHRGFGVNAAFLGHDLHGLVFGPDGMLYFSVGDRGFHIETPEGKTLAGPRVGAVFRCRPDGSRLEVVARGMRNPQELAFDAYGNLFAADNNCDKGDHSRLVYVVEGGNSGWNMSYQTLGPPYLTGPWHAEKMWRLANPDQPAWIVPPVGKLGAGPSGFLYTSGVALAERYRNRFLMCNYTGGGGIESFGVVEHGAGFQIVDSHDFFKPLSATDVAEGYDGKLYVSDFVKLDWSGAGGKGRIYTLFDPQQLDTPLVAQVRRLFAEGFARRPADELVALLKHPDMRVRQRAQFALAERGAEAIPLFVPVAQHGDDQFARLHAVWGLGQVAQSSPQAAEPLEALLDDADLQVRAQAIKVLGDANRQQAAPRLVPLLDDASLRIRFFAAMALGKLHYKPAVRPLLAMLRANEDADPFLRHAGVTALAWIGQREPVVAATRDASAAARMAALLVLRRWSDPRVALLLDDADPRIVTEAARAINDLPIDSATESLARLIDRYAAAQGQVPEPLLRRVINANFRLDRLDSAQGLARLAANPAHSAAMRREALAALADWSKPPPRDRVTGFWRPLPERDPQIAAQAVREQLTQILASAATAPGGELQTQATTLVERLDIQADEGLFFRWVGDAGQTDAARIAALRLLAQRKSTRLETAVEQALASRAPVLRAAARDVLCSIDPQRGRASLVAALASGETAEQQLALASLACLNEPADAAQVASWLERLMDGKVAPELALDVLEAAQSLKQEAIDKQLAAYRQSLPGDDPLAPFRVSLHGGDAQRGRRLFMTHLTGQCVRCHKVAGEGGTAGPDLSQIAAKNTREQLLQSLIDPNARIAPGFGSVTLALVDGRVLGGTLAGEDDTKLVLVTPQGERLTIAKDTIDARSPAQSPMPPQGKTLTLRELRDLVEYLAGLK